MINKRNLGAVWTIDIKTMKPLIALIRSETNLLTSQIVALVKELVRSCATKRNASHGTIKCKVYLNCRKWVWTYTKHLNMSSQALSNNRSSNNRSCFNSDLSVFGLYVRLSVCVSVYSGQTRKQPSFYFSTFRNVVHLIKSDDISCWRNSTIVEND